MNKISQIEMFLTFEDFRHEDDTSYWLASDLLRMLGYDDMDSFEEPIKKAKEVFKTLNIPLEENFISVPHHNGGEDYKLSIYACYIVVMNSGSNIEQVARAKVYFAQQTRNFEVLVQNRGEVSERLNLRNEYVEGYWLLSDTVKKAGLEDYEKFKDAGYFGLYNMHKAELADKRGQNKDSIVDYMSDLEYSINAFRVSLAEGKIEDENIKGQKNLETAHKEIGEILRDLVFKLVDTYPEDLPIENPTP